MSRTLLNEFLFQLGPFPKLRSVFSQDEIYERRTLAIQKVLEDDPYSGYMKWFFFAAAARKFKSQQVQFSLISKNEKDFSIQRRQLNIGQITCETPTYEDFLKQIDKTNYNFISHDIMYLMHLLFVTNEGPTFQELDENEIKCHMRAYNPLTADLEPISPEKLLLVMPKYDKSMKQHKRSKMPPTKTGFIGGDPAQLFPLLFELIGISFTQQDSKMAAPSPFLYHSYFDCFKDLMEHALKKQEVHSANPLQLFIAVCEYTPHPNNIDDELGVYIENIKSIKTRYIAKYGENYFGYKTVPRKRNFQYRKLNFLATLQRHYFEYLLCTTIVMGFLMKKQIQNIFKSIVGDSSNIIMRRI